ncbi:Predicted membrane protein [Nocardia otitidiscaviarum]|uniref:Predicted membrane protein n=1 Tax=Nocardia otitidiscaviarum TaxID=1823 RepID=A0A379JIR8_9NOCA|nr:YfhO family protein [Nocardia otitidiscaviarum]SUD48340.1 Predicted membrane protein [Nocardia otitidiscaviarum]
MRSAFRGSGRVSATRDVAATSVSETDTTRRVRVSSARGGQVVFARLGRPGYRATLDGRPVPISTVVQSFVAVRIPAGTESAELVLTWRPPGWKIGLATGAAGVLGLAVSQWWYLRTRRSDGAEESPPAPDGERAAAAR